MTTTHTRPQSTQLLIWQRLASVALLVLVLGQMLGWWSSTALQRLEWLSYDLRVQATLSGAKDPSLVIIDIDENSLKEVGQWPWSRERVAELVTALFEREQISLLGMDTVFAEAEGDVLAQRWQRHQTRHPQLANIPPPPSGDEVFADTLKRYPVVMGYYFQARKAAGDPDSSGGLPSPVPMTNPPAQLQQIAWPQPERYTGNLNLLQQAAAGGGFFDNPMVDDDGVFRRVPLLQRWREGWYPSLPLAMFHQLLGQPAITAEIVQGGGQAQLEALDVGGFRIPVDGHGAVLVPYFGQRGHFDYIPAADVLAGRVKAGRLNGAVAILGSSAPGLLDLRATPVQSVYPGPEINLSVLAGLLQQNFRSAPPWVFGAEFMALLSLGLVMTWLYPKLSALPLFSGSLVLLAAWVGGNLWAWQQGWLLPVASGLVLLVGLMLLHLLFNLWRESREKSWVTQCFGQYVPPELVEDMMDKPEALGLEGEERELTVLFSDVRGFTSFSEKIPPAQLTTVMNRLLSPLTRAIHDHRGTIDKYMGDAIMAFWGAPLRDTDHARHALEGAFAMQKALHDINREFTAEGLPALAMGIGLNSGPMNVGNMGSNFRMAYTVLGDNVNLGSRIEGMTKPYGVSILVSETTAALVPDWSYRQVDKVRVKGRSQPVWILEPLGPSNSLTATQQQQLQQHQAALQAYHQGQFAEAQHIFAALYEQDSHNKLAAIYLERAQHYLSTPPAADWDGVWTHTEK